MTLYLLNETNYGALNVVHWKRKGGERGKRRGERGKWRKRESEEGKGGSEEGREGVRREREGVMKVVTRLDAMHCKTASSLTHSTSHTTPPTQATHLSSCAVQITKNNLHLAHMLHAQNAYTR